MNVEALAIIEDSAAGSDNGRYTFPQVLANLNHAGVERYHTDLQRSEKTFYTPEGDSAVVKTKPVGSAVARDFDPTGVESAIRAVQKGQIGYMEFCHQIARAGCTSYIVSLAGRRAVYYGRSGESLVEPFPQ